jgi:hypothetical protein
MKRTKHIISIIVIIVVAFSIGYYSGTNDQLAFLKGKTLIKTPKDKVETGTIKGKVIVQPHDNIIDELCGLVLFEKPQTDPELDIAFKKVQELCKE